MEPVRAFIAIELPVSVKAVLSQLQDALKQNGHASVKWVEPDSSHLTLKFLGNIATEAIPEITKTISEVTSRTAPFRLNLGDLGAFPNLRAPRVLWIGLQGETANLSVLQKNVDSALVPLGFPPEKKVFSPHLTLGRVREIAAPNDRRRLGEIAASLKVDSLSSFTVDSLNIMRSRLTREGAIYSRLYSAALQGG